MIDSQPVSQSASQAIRFVERYAGGAACNVYHFMSIICTSECVCVDELFLLTWPMGME